MQLSFDATLMFINKSFQSPSAAKKIQTPAYYLPGRLLQKTLLSNILDGG
jgi:hypothetical protein